MEALGLSSLSCWLTDRRCVWLSRSARKNSLLQRGRRSSGERKRNEYESIGKPIQAFIKPTEKTPYGHGAGQMNKLLKINLANYRLPHLRVSHAPLGTQSKGGRCWGGRGVTTSCLGNYHHFWRELRGPLSRLIVVVKQFALLIDDEKGTCTHTSPGTVT